MSKSLDLGALAAAISLSSVTAQANATVGQPAPAFSAVDIAGKAAALTDFEGRTVVLE